MADQAFTQAIAAFEASPVTAQDVGADICEIYKKVKPILNGILPFLKLIPVYGATVATAITALMGVLDNTCPGS
jgi:hypothetical protein